LGKYEKLNRITLHINENYYLLITLDIEERNFDTIITEKVVPLIRKEKENFRLDNEDVPNKSASA